MMYWNIAISGEIFRQTLSAIESQRIAVPSRRWKLLWKALYSSSLYFGIGWNALEWTVSRGNVFFRYFGNERRYRKNFNGFGLICHPTYTPRHWHPMPKYQIITLSSYSVEIFRQTLSAIESQRIAVPSRRWKLLWKALYPSSLNFCIGYNALQWTVSRGNMFFRYFGNEHRYLKNFNWFGLMWHPTYTPRHCSDHLH